MDFSIIAFIALHDLLNLLVHSRPASTQQTQVHCIWLSAQLSVHCRADWSPVLEQYESTAAVTSSAGHILFKGLAAKVTSAEQL